MAVRRIVSWLERVCFGGILGRIIMEVWRVSSVKKKESKNKKNVISKIQDDRRFQSEEVLIYVCST